MPRWPILYHRADTPLRFVPEVGTRIKIVPRDEIFDMVYVRDDDGWRHEATDTYLRYPIESFTWQVINPCTIFGHDWAGEEYDGECRECGENS
jgi:hypothetical protein